jgi:hypothetical protein
MRAHRFLEGSNTVVMNSLARVVLSCAAAPRSTPDMTKTIQFNPKLRPSMTLSHPLLAFATAFANDRRKPR